MAGALVQHKETNIASYSTSIALAFDSNVTAGNLIDVFVFWNNEDTHEGGSTAADGLGNTYTNIAACNVGDSAQARSVQVLYAKNITGGACTVTVTLPGNRTARYLAISEWSGLDTTAPADQGNGAYQAAVTAVATGNVTPGSDGQTILSSFRVTTGATTTITEESTVVFEDETNVAASQYETQSSAASIAGNWTLGAARNVISVVRTYKPAASGTTLYFLDSAASGSNFGQLQVGGSPPSTATTATGWTVDTVGATNYALMAYASERASTVFSGTAQPAGNPDNSLGDCFRSTSTMSGDFATGVWTIAVPVIAVSAAAGQDGRVRVRLWKSSNATGTSPTEITSGAVAGTTVTNLTTGAEQVSTVTTGSITGFSLANEYLFVQIAWEITGAAT